MTMQTVADIDQHMAHARRSWRHWMAIARQTRLEMPEERYGHCRALAGAAAWRRMLRDMLTQRRTNTTEGAAS